MTRETEEIFSLDDAARLLFVVWADRLSEADAIAAYDALSPYDKAEWQRRAKHHHSDVQMFAKENAALRAALEPFARLAEGWEPALICDDGTTITYPDDDSIVLLASGDYDPDQFHAALQGITFDEITVGDLRAARAALSASKQEGAEPNCSPQGTAEQETQPQE